MGFIINPTKDWSKIVRNDSFTFHNVQWFIQDFVFQIMLKKFIFGRVLGNKSWKIPRINRLDCIRISSLFLLGILLQVPTQNSSRKISRDFSKNTFVFLFRKSSKGFNEFSKRFLEKLVWSFLEKNLPSTSSQNLSWVS